MQQINQVRSELGWSQPSGWKMEYELRSGEDLIGSLRFRSALGTLATGESADGCWTFKRVGFWQTRATIRACGSEADIATFQNNTWKGGGTLTLPDGRTFLATTNFWQTHVEIQTEDGVTLVRMDTSGVLRANATVEITPEGRATRELLWMVLFGWYVVVMLRMDSSGVAASSGG